jgi:hypothetical protein
MVPTIVNGVASIAKFVASFTESTAILKVETDGSPGSTVQLKEFVLARASSGTPKPVKSPVSPY